MSAIADIISRQIMDSRGNPTIECDVVLADGCVGRAAAPSGASTGAHEAIELRDGGMPYGGKGVMTALQNVDRIIAPALLSVDPFNQREIDAAMIRLDGTPNKSKLGANAVLAVSLAVAAACAASKKQPLFKYLGDLFGNANFVQPAPMMNILNGGAHADNGLAIQEFMIVPIAATIAERIRVGSEIFHKLKSILRAEKLSTGVGDEGGFAPNIDTARAALDFIMRAGDGYDFGIALDVAASEFFKDGAYEFEGKSRNSAEMIGFFEKLVADYPIVSIEDGFAEDDWDGWKELTRRMGAKIQLVGDDLFATNAERLRRGINDGVANAILIKPNQIGTLTETLDVIRMAMDAGYKTVISHRSGETEDSFIADLAVGVGAGQIKTGSMSRTDRMCKYNQLVRIDELLL